MSAAASGWLMTSLDPHPLSVSLVQVASSLPLFLWAIPGGALADLLDRRKFLIAGELTIMAASIPLAVLVSWHLVTPKNLLLITFAVSSGFAVIAPAWQAVVTQLVPRAELAAAISANTVSINVMPCPGPSDQRCARARAQYCRAVLVRRIQQHWSHRRAVGMASSVP